MDSLNTWLGYSVRRKHLDADLETMRDRMRGCVLEIGNGRENRRGKFLPPDSSAKTWVYVDLSAQKKPHALGDAQQLPFRNASFDSVVCLEVLQYVSHPPSALNEMRRVLRDEGVIIFSTPFLHRADEACDLWRFTEHGLRKLCGDAKLEIVLVKPQGHALATAVNTLKYSIYVRPVGWRRTLLGHTSRPLLSWLWKSDTQSAERQPELATFSTGFLLVARKM